MLFQTTTGKLLKAHETMAGIVNPPLSAFGNLRVAVTGAKGRLAKLLIPDLKKVCREVVSVSRESGEGLMTWSEALNGGLKGVDVLVHTAWSCVPLTSHSQGKLTGLSDMRMCAEIMNNNAACELKQLVFFSSASVYGPTEGRRITEDHFQNPRSLYSTTKSCVENLFHVLGRERGLTPCVLRITNPYGFSYDPHRPQGLIAHAADCLKKNKTLDVWGTGTIPKDYLHISDLGSALHAVIERNLSGTFNVSSGESHTALEVFRIIEAVAGRRLMIRFTKGYDWDSGMGAILHEKLAGASGWRPRKNISEGLADVINHALKLTHQ